MIRLKSVDLPTFGRPTMATVGSPSVARMEPPQNGAASVLDARASGPPKGRRVLVLLGRPGTFATAEGMRREPLLGKSGARDRGSRAHSVRPCGLCAAGGC